MSELILTHNQYQIVADHVIATKIIFRDYRAVFSLRLVKPSVAL